MNINQKIIQTPIDISAKSSTICSDSKGYTADDEEEDKDVIDCMDTHMAHLSLVTSLDTMDTTISVKQHIADQRVPQSLRQNIQHNFTGQKGSSPVTAAAAAATAPAPDDDDEDDDDALLEIVKLEEFYNDELWTKEQLRQPEQLLFIRKIESLLNDASKSPPSVNPLRKVLELEYYALTKLAERFRNEVEQLENIEIAEAIMKEEQEQQEEEAKEKAAQRNNGTVPLPPSAASIL